MMYLPSFNLVERFNRYSTRTDILGSQPVYFMAQLWEFTMSASGGDIE